MSRYRDPAAAYADAIDAHCEACGAEPGQLCTNPINQRPRRIPCVRRGQSGHTHDRAAVQNLDSITDKENHQP
ncbi:hypothetical protein OG579_16825 [Williamsia herbipolensis]|uniref:Uncharacterized protein n=1 Tax=Williamsia herbipolensis TaxID=1603258 RepID=A0AAU4K044_9NOCA|nr:hypothetical protein [Williamsia herbipolensis]